MPVKKLLSREDHRNFVSNKGYVIVIHVHEGDWPSQQMIEKCVEYCRIYEFAQFAQIDTDIYAVSTGHIPIAYTPTATFFRNGKPMNIQVAGTDYEEMERILNSMRNDGYVIAGLTPNMRSKTQFVTIPDATPIMRVRSRDSLLHK